MRHSMLAAGLAAALLFAGPAVAQESYIKTVEDAAAVDPDATVVRVRLGDTAILRAVVDRAPAIETLVISHPGNKLDTACLPVLRQLPALRSLTLSGDAFLYDEEFAALGRLTQLETLNLHLP